MELDHIRRGQGEPLLLIQGMAGTPLTWGDQLLDALAEDFDVIAIANRGVGGGAHVTDAFTIADMAADAAGALDALGIDSAHVLGISMGGMIAQELVLRDPERVRTLTLGCTFAGGPGATRNSPAVMERLGQAWSSGDQERAIRTGWEANVSRSFAAGDDDYTAFRERVLAQRVPLALIQLQLQAAAAHDTTARLGAVTTPTLVIHGDEDEMIPVENGRIVASLIPGARLEVFEGVGHLFWLEEPQRSVELIRGHAERATTAG
jgi:pimeloyl-ACP methyl ester carboxylesterase